jgi:hypothetical protein
MVNSEKQKEALSLARQRIAELEKETDTCEHMFHRCLKCSDGIHTAVKVKTVVLAESERKIKDMEKTVLAGMFVCQVSRRWL